MKSRTKVAAKGLAARIFTTGDEPQIGVNETSGLGSTGRETVLNGDIHKFEICKDGVPQFSIRIGENGDLILTDYEGRREISMDNNIQLRTSRPWKVKS